jgi:glutaredoxin-like YruB-family protein
LKEIKSIDEFEKNLKESNKPVALYFHGSFSPVSEKVLTRCKNLSENGSISNDVNCFSVDVEKVKGLHKQYNIETVPTLLIFKDGSPKEWVIGEQSEEYFKNVLLDKKYIYSAEKSDSGKKYPSVTVYSTPSCGFCTKLKNYLDDNGVPYRDIDIARDQSAADDLVNKTGQQGVPQSFIGSTHVMGFDLPKINRLLGLQ